MSPEDDVQALSATGPLSSEWKPITKSDVYNSSPTSQKPSQHNSTNTNNNYHNNGAAKRLNSPEHTNGNSANNNPTYDDQNKVSKHLWTPLLNGNSGLDSELSEHNNPIEQNSASNNNDWKTMTKVAPVMAPLNGASKDNEKNGWKEIPQDDDHGVITSGPRLKTIGETVHNGHSEKLAEEDPLTGGLGRIPTADQLSNCGIGSCQPKWARIFASTHVFMVVFLLAWVLQGMYYTYFVSVITTIEKLFQIKSKTTGMLMSATEVGQIMTALFLTYFAGRGHRPRWIACGMVLFAIASFGCTLPHFIFGNQLLHANNAFYGGGSVSITSFDNDNAGANYHNSNESLRNANTSLTISRLDINLCKISDPNGFANGSACEENIRNEQAAHSQIKNVVLCIFFFSLLGVGIGQTAVSTLGIPYIDDNVASRESPIYIAITIGVRILGPAAGFILGSFCTRHYVDLSDPGFGPSDPKWVGAWYLGLALISSLMIITSFAMFMFPKNLKGNRIPPPMKMRAIEAQKKMEKQEEDIKPKLKDFPKTIKRQLSNDILMFRTASSVLHLLPVAGLYTFLPKYLETQFHLTAHDANLVSGFAGILVMGVGIVISGVVILKFSPTARSVAAWIAFTAIVYAAGMAVLMFIGCSMDNLIGLNSGYKPKFTEFLPVCNRSTTCECDITKFSPICGSDNLTYFSPCHAGCTVSTIEHGKTQFSNCECIPETVSTSALMSFEHSSVDAVSGFCKGKCQNYVMFMLLFSFFVFMHSTSEVGSMLLIMRCTDPKDKAMAMGIIQFAIGLFGNVPCPIIYGAVIDSTCLIWEMICDKPGACSLYNVDAFRHFFLGTTAGIMFLAFIMDVVVWHKAHRIDIDPESNASETDIDKPTMVPESVV